MASSDLVNMGISVVSYTLKDIRDDEVSFQSTTLSQTSVFTLLNSLVQAPVLDAYYYSASIHQIFLYNSNTVHPCSP